MKFYLRARPQAAQRKFPRQKIPRRIVMGLLFASVALSCTQQIAPQSQPQPNEIRIGVIASLTGDATATGQSTVRGSEMAVKEINEIGGLKIGDRRYNVALEIEDDQDEVDVAVTVARKLIYRDNVVAIVGPQLSRNAIPVAKFVESAQIPMISPLSTNPETTKDKRYVFRATFIDSVQGQVMAHFTRNELNAQTAAVLYDIASPYNQGIADVFKRVFESEGGQIVAFETYTTGEKDFRTQLTTIRQQNPEVLFLPNYNRDLMLQLQQARQLDIEATLLGSDSWGTLGVDALKRLNGAFFSNQYSPDTTNIRTQAFMERYQQSYQVEPDTAAAVTYDAFNVLFKAIQNQRKSDSESIRQGLSELGRYDGVTGTIEYQGTGDPLRSVLILQVKNGQPVFYQQVDP